MTSRYAIVVTTYAGQPSVAELRRTAALGKGPRRDYVMLASTIDAEVIDAAYLAHTAPAVIRTLRRGVGTVGAQVLEAYRRRNDFARVCLWSEQLGLPLGLLHKVTRARSDLVLMATYLSPAKKAVFLRQLRVHSHLGAIVSYSSVQMHIAEQRLRVPRSKLHHAMQPVDELFWRPEYNAAEANLICTVGWAYRDYETLFEAIRGMDIRVAVAVGKTFRAPGAGDDISKGMPKQVPPNVTIHQQLPAQALRDLYARSRFVIVPVRDVECDAGGTAIGEAMAMGKPVIVTRTRGQADFVTDGVHGLLVTPHDPRSMRAAIERLLRSDDEVMAMGREGRRFAEERLSLDGYVRKVGDIITGPLPR
jgi:glycosyltransferase involved in cell wall biosynthesis